MDASRPPPAIDETSIRYDGWRIVAVCFLVATFGWAFGFYGQSVYVAELHRLHGWPTSLISTATTFFYLFGAAAGRLRQRSDTGVRPAQLPAGRRGCDGVGRCFDRSGHAPWQLYAVNALLAFGWAGTSLGMITNTLGLWFDNKRGMAISLALNGASFGGIVGVPLIVTAIGSFGFSGAMIVAAVTMVVLLVPVILIFVGRPPDRTNRRCVGRRGCAVSVADTRAGVSRCRFPVGVDCIRAGAVRAGRLYRPPDLVPRSGDRPRARGDRGGADDGDGGGRPRAVLDGDRPAEPAAGVGDLLCQPGRCADRHHQSRTTTLR